MNAAVFSERRRRVLDAIGPASAMVLAASPELRVGHDAELKYLVDPDLWYLTGYAEPEAVAVIGPAGAEAPFTLFVRPRDPAKETWTGRRGGVEAAREVHGADAAHPVTELAERLPKLLANVDTLHARLLAQRPDVEDLVTAALAAARRSRPRTGKGPLTLTDPGLILNEMRLRKDASELRAIRKAADISVQAFRQAACAIRPGAGEWQVEAALESAFRVRGASGPAFPTIVASGPNATVLHHVSNDRVLAAEDLVLVDAGARNDMYCADLTRTFPVSGRFAGAGLEVYDIVLAAHDAAIAAARPGASVLDVHEAALGVLVQGLLDLGLVEGVYDDLVRDDAGIASIYPHRTSHWLGLDVHDVGDYMVGGAARMLEPGMVFTVEPGLYVPADSEAPAALRGVGVRIEDDVLVTEDGAEVLTAGLPVRRDDVEAMLGG